MQNYQVRVFSEPTCLYGGHGVKFASENPKRYLAIKNEKFGESISIRVILKRPTQSEVLLDLGILAAEQALCVDLAFVLCVEAWTSSSNLDTNVACSLSMFDSSY